MATLDTRCASLVAESSLVKRECSLTNCRYSNKEAGRPNLSFQQVDGNCELDNARPNLVQHLDTSRNAVNISTHQGNRGALLCGCSIKIECFLEDQGDEASSEYRYELEDEMVVGDS